MGRGYALRRGIPSFAKTTRYAGAFNPPKGIGEFCARGSRAVVHHDLVGGTIACGSVGP